MTKLHPAAYEPTDAGAPLLAALALGLAAFLLIAPPLLFLLFPGARHAERLQGPFPRPPGPRLQPDPSADLARLSRREERVLSSYGWVDRAQGTVRIPIAHAMELVAKRGLPQWSDKAAAPLIPPRASAPR